MAKKTGKVQDDREIRQAVRLPGIGKGKGWKPNKSVGPVDYQRGELITDPDRLQALADEGRLDLKDLYKRGVIVGESWRITA